MLNNYLKIAVRNLSKHKIYSFINIIGLAIAIAFCILTFLFVRDEFTFDRFHKNKNHIYRLCVVTKEPSGEINYHRSLPTPLLPKLTPEFPQIQYAVRCYEGSDEDNTIIHYDDMALRESALLVDSDFLKIFTFPLIKGNPETALQQKHEVIISHKLAKKLFGKTDPLGKRLSINHWMIDDGFQDFIITGVMKNVPNNSSLQFDLLIPFENISREMRWSQYNTISYIQLQQNIQAEELEVLFATYSKQIWQHKDRVLTLQPLTSVHLFPLFAKHQIESDSKPLYSYLLLVIAIAVLGIACMNYINLSLGHYSTRVNEIGIRKSIGAQREQLIYQFLCETILLSFGALLLGIVLVELFIPTFNALSQKNVSSAFITSYSVILFLIGLMLLVGISVGSYPAFIISRLQPTKIIRGHSKLGKKTRWSRLAVVTQFIVSIAFIIITLVTSQQLNLLTSDLGFAQKNIIKLKIPYGIDSVTREKVYGLFSTELMKSDDILSVSMTGRGVSREIESPITWIEHEGVKTGVWGDRIDYNYLDLLEIELVEGRNFSKEFSTDVNESVIVNEALVKKFSWESGIGKQIRYRERRQIIGVVKDYHSVNKRSEIQPTVLILNNYPSGSPLIKVKPGRVRAAMSFIQKKWHQLCSHYPFEFEFLDAEIVKEYWEEIRWGRIFGYVTVFCLLIACLGIYGLVSLTTVRRTKEIGIRKVLGATIPNILVILTKDFTKWILIANLIAWPIAYYTMSKWLQNFAYRIDMNWWMFALAGALALMIALLTVSWQAIRAAITNPVNALRYE